MNVANSLRKPPTSAVLNSLEYPYFFRGTEQAGIIIQAPMGRTPSCQGLFHESSSRHNEQRRSRRFGSARGGPNLSPIRRHITGSGAGATDPGSGERRPGAGGGASPPSL